MIEINWDVVQAFFVIVAVIGVAFLILNSMRKDD